MRLVQLLARAIRVHPREDDDPVLPRGLQQLAEEIAIAKKLRAAMKRHLGRVVGDDAAGIDDDALRVGALPVLAPPRDVVARDVELGDVGLHPSDVRRYHGCESLAVETQPRIGPSVTERRQHAGRSRDFEKLAPG